MIEEQLDNWIPKIISETKHFALLKRPPFEDDVMVTDIPKVAERLRFLGYDLIDADCQLYILCKKRFVDHG